MSFGFIDFMRDLKTFPQRFLMKNPPAFLKPCFMRPSFVKDIFLKLYYPNLALRKNTFLKLFEMLEKNPEKTFSIVETGTARKFLYNMAGDGASTFLFDAFLRYYDGTLISIDADEEACRKAGAALSRKTRVVCCDSLVYLKKIQGLLDLVYLDSFDLDFHAPQLSAEHHLKEFEIINSKIKPGGFLLIDDAPASAEYWPAWIHAKLKEKGMTVKDLPAPNGKGYLVEDLIRRRGTYAKILHEYQCFYQKK